ncbi:hypothetical protein [Streptomyces sp. NPDC002889]|uniref:hypothetical protein n=1 Tax=Streptomyces sp. NPDC002889 TaxID=3364669 RepID=UPI0036A4D1A9
MSMGEWLGDNGPRIVVTVVMAGETISTALNGPQAAVALYGALLAAGVWAWHGRYTFDRAVSGGHLAKLATWDLYIHHRTPPEDDDGLYTAMAQRMRQTDQHVRAFAAQHSLELISIALPTKREAFGDARSTRHGNRGHLWLGTRWFHPRHAHHLPAVREHELAHLRRRDTRKRLVAETTAVAAAALAAGLLTLPALALTALTAWLGIGAVHWWSELACDAAAVRACGRSPVAAMWSADLAEERTMPWPSRTRHTLRALHRHPPLRLRRWFARRAPLPLPDASHPLTITPGTMRAQATPEQ